MPEEILKGNGKSVSIKDYDIVSSNEGQVSYVKNKNFGTIKFIAQLIDQECGYVVGSKAIVYTAEYGKNQDMLNLVHCHINDTSDQVTMEVEYMVDDQSIKDFEDFKTDVTGRALRYKILVRD